jgi:hypothetical protein
MSDDSIHASILTFKHARRNSGFALVIALSLMAFVLLLLLSVTTLVSVETSSSQMTKQKLLAQNNALLAMQVALGNLQIAAGPDQRATSTADIRATTDPSKAKYTVVWDATEEVASDGEATPLKWLVSGTISSETDDDGNLVDFGASAVDEALGWPVLVSEREKEQADPDDPDSVTTVVEAVRVEPVPLTNNNNQKVGEMAWWVGDEGVKAKFNLTESTYFRDLSGADPDQRLGVSSRFGIEALEGFETPYAYTDDDFVAKLRKMISAGQAPILDSALETPLSKHYHDIGFYSRGLLTNTRDGGLKEDLTYYFELSDDLTQDPPVQNPERLTGPIIENSQGAKDTTGATALDRITWEQLNSFYNLGNEIETETTTDEDTGDEIATGEVITARAQEEDAAGVYPILTMMHLNYGFTMEGAGSYDSAIDSDATSEEIEAAAKERSYNVYTHIRPAFVLANPYNTKLKVSNYRIRFNPSDSTDVILNVYYGVAYQRSIDGVPVVDDDGDPSMAMKSFTITTHDYKDLLSNMIFVVPEVTLEPGQALYFSLSEDDDYDKKLNVINESAYVIYDESPLKEQQFVFAAQDDGGITSIRIGDPGVITGDVIEFTDGSNRRIRRMGVGLLNKTGSIGFRTYIGETNTPSEDDKILQDIGPFRYYDMGYYFSYHTQQGYWLIDSDKLPVGLMSYHYPADPNAVAVTNTNNDPDINMSGYAGYGEFSTTGFSNIYFMHSAITRNPTNDIRGWFTGYDGWATDYNIRAPRMARFSWQSSSKSPPLAFSFEILGDGTKYYEQMRSANMNGELGTISTDASFTWGASYTEYKTASLAIVKKAILFDIPRLDENTKQPSITSLGQLQHFNPGGWTESFPTMVNTTMYTTGITPSYAIGNSYAAPQIPREATIGVDDAVSATFSDVSYLLNEALFDRYFFSTIPQVGDIDYERLPHKRLVQMDETVDDKDVRSSGTAAAEDFWVDGAFNVNSTSVDAWYALLNSFKGFEFGDKDSSAPGQGIFPRSLYQSVEFVEGGAGVDEDGNSVDIIVDGITNADATWAGWRHLEDEASATGNGKLYLLAEAIVEEVKARGPFLSISDFVNRKLVNNADANARLGLSGALQAALDRIYNNQFDSDYDARTTSAYKGIVDYEHQGSGPIFKTDGTTLITPASAASSTPGWVLQGDLLQALAPALAVRSDTFTIRGYGNVLNPVTGKITAEAYVEAIVQRIPEYVDTSDDANTNVLVDIGDPLPLSESNQLLGRRFSIVDIRFLDPSEI